MASVIEAAFTLFIIIIGGFIALGVLTNTNSINTGNCAYNSTGGLENCSLSNNDYKMLNSTSTQYATIFNVLPSFGWILVMALVIAIFLQIAGWVR